MPRSDKKKGAIDRNAVIRGEAPSTKATQKEAKREALK